MEMLWLCKIELFPFSVNFSTIISIEHPHVVEVRDWILYKTIVVVWAACSFVNLRYLWWVVILIVEIT